MLGIGVVEGFFGPEWSWQARHHFCENLKAYGGDFYIYAPKRDPYLRKNWFQTHPTETWAELKRLSLKCQQKKVAFGVGLSPFEIHASWNQQSKQRLREKVEALCELDLKYLGLFFDDMKGANDLAEKQIEIVEYVKSVTDRTLLFCPTYYSHDLILDKVFGQRPIDYLSSIGKLSEGIQIFWTGSQVISHSISADELRDIEILLKRKPVIWDNIFANDGPKQCKFLKLKPLEWRTQSALQSSAGWAFNLMNQPELSEILFASSVRVLAGGESPSAAFNEEIERARDSSLLKKYLIRFVEKGLESIGSQERIKIAQMFSPSGSSKEIRDWLHGTYLVGDECLTD